MFGKGGDLDWGKSKGVIFIGGKFDYEERREFRGVIEGRKYHN